MKKTQLKILFIEDNADDVNLALLELEKEGFEVDWKRVDSEKGLQRILANWEPDIILSDHSMPSFNGLEALETAKRLVPEVPLIFVSGTIGEERAIESIHRGATDYVLKDNLRRLRPAVRRAVEGARERRRALEMEKEKSRLIAILETTSDLVVIADLEGSVLYHNQGARALLDLGGDASRLSMRDLYAPWIWDFINGELHSSVIENGIWQGEAVLATGDGTEIPVSQVIISHKDERGTVEFFSFIARDIRERRAYEERIQYLANFNSLTEMPNRSLLADRTAQAIGHSQWTSRSIALIIVDIDRFRLVNDGYGMETGDKVLKQFGRRLRNSVRERDTVAHLNADSFAVLLTELSAPDDVITVVRKVQNSLRDPISINDKALNITASIGVSLYPRDGKDFTALFQHANAAVNRAKERGEGSLQFYAVKMTANAVDRIEIENELYLALSRKQLELYYQPQISLETGKIVGLEALMRWRHPKRGLVSPGTFIPIAENSELIHVIGEWALATACKQMKEWGKEGITDVRITVNVSARQFRARRFSDAVANVLRASRLNPRLLELELTESALIHDHRDAVRILDRLNGLGVKIALDDFGTGYSNLSYLSRLPLHCLKVDQSFIRNSPGDAGDAEIVKAIISLAHSLGLCVVGEGIETDEQMAFLRDLGCDEGQGYLFSRPVPGEKIHALFSSGTGYFPPLFKKSKLTARKRGNP